MTSNLRLLIFAGPNGSGKSTFTTVGVLKGFEIPVDRYINADNITRELSDRMPNATQTEREWAAFYEARNRRETYREQRISFAFETVFSHPSTFLDIETCRQAGFEIIVIFVTTKNSAINVERVARRVLSGGHNVEREKIISRYQRSMFLLPRIVEQADRTFVYDNSNESPLKFSFQKGFQSIPQKILPPFLDRQLLQPLTQRQIERQMKINDLFLNDLLLPILRDSQYRGNILWSGRHYIVQSTIDSTLILHELCLFSGEQAQYLQERAEISINIRYQDAAASASVI